ncbi:hypothetical protein LCGC14_0823340 [marine sediment metagenome]|uniref:Uncharacterized protein n=1 Tax=marine sediment metagenome TaxID=412755 RepID=A0A0F9PI48_9ZZZZ
MNNIIIGRYNKPVEVGYQGWIEPSDKSWIAFIDLKGIPTFYLNRTETGSVS